MGSFALTDATIWIAGYDFTGDSNQVSLASSADELDVTTFGSGGYRSRIGGLKSVDMQLGGFWQSATLNAVDPQVFTNLGVADRVITVAPDDAETTPCYMFQGGKFSYERFGAIGEATPFSCNILSSNGVGMVRGQVAKAKGNVSAPAVLGSVVNLGAPTAAQFVYAAVHVFSAGTTMTLILESDTAANFPSTQTRATIGPITAAGGTWMTRVPGALAGETHWRLSISAITGTFQVAAAIAVQ